MKELEFIHDLLWIIFKNNNSKMILLIYLTLIK